MKAVITVTGMDTTGIIAKVSGECMKYEANIVDISQSVMKEYFAMIMLVDMDKLTIPFADFVKKLEELGKENCLDIHTMHEDIFKSMHRI